MAITAFYGFEFRATLLDNISFTGTAAYSTLQARTGAASVRCNPASGATGYVTVLAATHFGLYIASLPTVARQIAGNATSSAPRLILQPSGVLDLYTTSGLYGSSAALSTGVWYWVSLKTGVTSGVAMQIDGVDAITGSQSIGLGQWDTLGCFGTEASAIDVYFDDVISSLAVFLAPSKVGLLVPTADSARSTGWKTGAAGTTSLFAAVDNTPPTGVADPGTATSQIRNGVAEANGSYDATLTTYTAAGIVTGSTVLGVRPIVAVAAPVATTPKQGTVGVVSNPAIANIALEAGNGTAGAFWNAVAAGTFPTGWKLSRGTLTLSPTVTLGTAPVMRITQVTSNTQTADVAFMGLLVAWSPPTSVQHQVTGTATGTGQASASAALTLALSGSGSGTGAASGAAGQIFAATAAATGTGAASGAIVRTAAFSGSATGTGAPSGSLDLTLGVTGSAAGAGSATGASGIVYTVTGSAAGVGQASGAAIEILAETGSATGTGTASGTLSNASVTHQVTGSANGTGNATGATTRFARVDGTAAGAGKASASIRGTFALAGSATGVGLAAAGGSYLWLVSGSATGAGTATGSALRTAAFDGSATGTGALSGGARLTRPLTGSATGTGDATASPGGVVPVTGSATGTGAASGAGTLVIAASATASGVGLAAGMPTRIDGVSGSATGVGAGGGSLVLTQMLGGSALGQGQAAGIGALRMAVSGAGTGTGAASGFGRLIMPLGGTAVGTGLLGGAVDVFSAGDPLDPFAYAQVSLTPGPRAIVGVANRGGLSLSAGPSATVTVVETKSRV